MKARVATAQPLSRSCEQRPFGYSERRTHFELGEFEAAVKGFNMGELMPVPAAYMQARLPPMNVNLQTFEELDISRLLSVHTCLRTLQECVPC
jgi:hypothetical protein